jgi:hypothetical protein|tara:strand:- start:168 stop:704 length:537 start_codon:yes stop_codon:yes gene_type:complete
MKISFRQIEQEDLALLRDWRNQERLKKYFREYRLLNMLNQLDWFKNISTSTVNDMFLILADDNPVGVCGLTHINWKDRSAEISHYLGKQTNSAVDVAIGLEAYDFLKKKAFLEYNLNRLYGGPFSFNKGAIKLALHCGFKKEAVLRQSIFWNGKYWDTVILSLLAEEYYATTKDKHKN